MRPDGRPPAGPATAFSADSPSLQAPLTCRHPRSLDSKGSFTSGPSYDSSRKGRVPAQVATGTADRHLPRPPDPGPLSCHSLLKGGRSRLCADTRRLRPFVLPGVLSRGQLPRTPGAGEDGWVRGPRWRGVNGVPALRPSPAPTSPPAAAVLLGLSPSPIKGFDVLPHRPTAAHGDLLRLNLAESRPQCEQCGQVRMHHKPFHQDTGPPMVSLTDRHHDLRDGFHLGSSDEDLRNRFWPRLRE